MIVAGHPGKEYIAPVIAGYAAQSDTGVPYVMLGEGTPSLLVIPGIEPEHHLPDGLRLQGVRGAFEEIAERRPLAVAWRADRPAGEISIDSIAADYVDLARQLELTDLAILGVSTGSPMAIETAARLGPRCNRLLLVSGGASLSTRGRSLLERWVALAEAGLWRTLAREQIAAFYPGLFGACVLAPIAWLFPDLYGRPEDPAFFLALTRAVAAADLRTRCKDVDAPALLMNGERDLLYPPEIARETALLLTDADSVTLERAGHGAFKSHSGRIARLILANL